jgi:hypothetical protein
LELFADFSCFFHVTYRRFPFIANFAEPPSLFVFFEAVGIVFYPLPRVVLSRLWLVFLTRFPDTCFSAWTVFFFFADERG